MEIFNTQFCCNRHETTDAVEDMFLFDRHMIMLQRGFNRLITDIATVVLRFYDRVTYDIAVIILEIFVI